ncbi:MAG: CatB-related O-acetyltransferase [Saprospiraceae bacterium]
MKIFGNIILLVKKVIRKTFMYVMRPLFQKYGTNFIFNPYDDFSYKTISVGNDVFIGKGANFAASETFILIGSKVMIGPNVTIMGGDHNTAIIGNYMYDVKLKLAINDQPVIIEDDVWVGANVIILKGVTIGRGSIIGAGSVVTKSCQPYSIIAGVPAKLLRCRFTEEEILKHEILLKNNQ